MKTTLIAAALGLALASGAAWAGQTPYAASAKNFPVSHQDRVYSADQYSNTVSVIDPASNKLLGVIRLGESQPGNLSPLYGGQVLVHGMGFSPDHRTIAVVSIGSNSVSFIDTATNKVKQVTYLGRSPHEAFFTPDGKEVWVTVRGENYVLVLDGKTFKEKARIATAFGPGMQIFSPDGKYGYVCDSFNPVTYVIDAHTHKIIHEVKQASAFCPDIAATPDGKQVWFTLKDIGKTQVFNAKPPFNVIKTIDTGPITNHVNFAHNKNGTFAYVTIGGLNEVKVYRTDDFKQVATIPVGDLPHGLWPSGDGTRIYVGLEGAAEMAAIDTLTNKVIANIPVGQAPQAVTYVPDAVPVGDDGTANLQPLGLAGETAHIALGNPGAPKGLKAPTSVALYNQGLSQILEASVTGLQPGKPYVLAIAPNANGSGQLQTLAGFKANPAGASIVNAIGPIRQIVNGEDGATKRYMVIASGTVDHPGAPVQVQMSVR